MSTLADLDRNLRLVEQRYISLLHSEPNTPSGTIGISPSDHPTPMNPFSTAVTSSSPPSVVPPTVTSIVPDPPPARAEADSVPTQSSDHKRGSPATYLANRVREDEEGGEVGLLPLRTQENRELGERQRLLGPVGAVDGVGSAQLHEELGGQLSDVSTAARRCHQNAG